MKKVFLLGSMIFVFFAYFASFVGNTWAGDATLTLDDNAGSSSFVVQDVDKTNQFKVNSDGQGYFAGNVGIGTTGPKALLHLSFVGWIKRSESTTFRFTAEACPHETCPRGNGEWGMPMM